MKKKPKIPRKKTHVFRGESLARNPFANGQWLTVEEAAERAGMLPGTIRQYCLRGQIPHVKTGILIHTRDLAAFAKGRRPAGRPAKPAKESP